METGVACCTMAGARGDIGAAAMGCVISTAGVFASMTSAAPVYARGAPSDMRFFNSA